MSIRAGEEAAKQRCTHGTHIAHSPRPFWKGNHGFPSFTHFLIHASIFSHISGVYTWPRPG